MKTSPAGIMLIVRYPVKSAPPVLAWIEVHIQTTEPAKNTDPKKIHKTLKTLISKKLRAGESTRGETGEVLMPEVIDVGNFKPKTNKALPKIKVWKVVRFEPPV